MKTMTALLAATKGGHAETALRLLENRTIDIKIQDKVKLRSILDKFSCKKKLFKDGQTPLSHACAEGLTDVVAELVRRHAYVNTVDKVYFIMNFVCIEISSMIYLSRMVIPFFSQL
jgi:ankyrin repeat protein